MIVDSNVYLGNWPYWRVETTRADQLASHLEKNGIDKALVSSLKSVFYDAEEGNGELEEACSRYPERIYGLATLTPFSRREDDGYQGLTSGLFKGIRIYPAYHNYPLSNSTNIIEIAEAMKVPVVVPYRLIMSWTFPTVPIEGIVSLAKENPRVPFVISSLHYEAFELLLLREKPPNLYIETSALQNEGGAELLSSALGPDKLMLGTAAPVQYAQPGIQKIQAWTKAKGRYPRIKDPNRSLDRRLDMVFSMLIRGPALFVPLIRGLSILTYRMRELLLSAHTHARRSLLVCMGKFKLLVDRTIALVKERKSVGILDLAYELGVSPDYTRKVCLVAIAACKDPELSIEQLWHPDSYTRDKPALFIKSYFEETQVRLREAAHPK